MQNNPKNAQNFSFGPGNVLSLGFSSRERGRGKSNIGPPLYLSCSLVNNTLTQTRTVCGALLAHGGVDFPSPPCPAVGHAWGCPQGEARGLKTTLLAQRSGKVPLGPLGMASCPSPDTLSSFAPTPGCVGTAPSFWLPLSSQSRCAHCRREGLAGPPGRGT